MSKLVQAILEHLPRRRRRFWRYVSPRRRGMSLLLLALLGTGFYGYWHLTNDARITRQAERYLHKLTGCSVEIEGATFKLFGGIELNGVRIRIPGDESTDPFFQARQVLLKHRPWGLFFRRRLEPVEIVCVEPVVTLAWDANEGRYTVQKLFSGHRDRVGPTGPDEPPLPAILARDLRLRQPTGEMQLHLTMLPRETGVYNIGFEENRPGEQGPIYWSFLFNVVTGEFTPLAGQVPDLARLDQALPEEYRRWRERYDIRGKVLLKGQAATAPASGFLEAELVDVSLKLPPEEGGLDLSHVRGTLVFERSGVTLRKIAGQVVQAGDAAFELSGRYEKYETTSPFRLAARVTGMTVPEGQPAPADGKEPSGAAKLFREFHRLLRPQGRLDLTVEMERSSDGTTTYHGVATPRGLSVVYAEFPYRVEEAAGTVEFSPGRIDLREITARRNGAAFRLNGYVLGNGDHDVSVQVENLLLDPEVGQAAPAGFREVLRTLQPEGRAAVEVRVRQGGERTHQTIDVEVKMDGRAAMTHARFPYRLEELRGQVRFSGDQVLIDHVHGRRGTMQCTLHGTVDNAQSDKPEVNVTVAARSLPLDAALAAALDERARKAMDALHPGGQADSVTAYLKQSGGAALTCEITAALKDVSLRPDAFPYAIEEVSGVLTVSGDLIEFRDLAGRHARSPIHIGRGQVMLGQKEFGLDLREVVAADVEMDEALHDALPAGLRDVWGAFQPGGRADVTLDVRHNTPGLEGRTDYRLVLAPKGMTATYRDFPYPFRDIAGNVTATPGRVVLDVTAGEGKMRAGVSGTILSDERGSWADLLIDAAALPVDSRLLAALPREFDPLVRRLKAGGTCDVRKLHLRFTPSSVTGEASAETGPASRPEAEVAAVAPASRPVDTQPATQPAPAAWDASGAVAFADLILDVGDGQRLLRGSVSGTASRSAEGMTVEADIRLDSVQLGKREIRKLSGRVLKNAASAIVRIDDLVGDIHGGRLAGQAEVRLAEPPQYGIFLSLERLRLEDLFADAKDKGDVGGLLAGNIQLTGTAGKDETRKASGVFQITRARMYRLPVLMGLLNIVYLSLPGDTAFTEGQMTYRVVGNRLILDEIFLNGPALSIVGSGTMNLATEKITLNFLAGPPGKLPRLASLDELLNTIARELIEYQITGTLTEPRVRTVPLKGLDAAIRRLLSPEQE